ncbi:MAG: tetrathionate reductase family octaheme c-type cytochrome [Chlorobi bacterium]|nr:tetrathionate reductase family octaheme c-type cytochrome [Chlorobiota bacterium]
MRLLLFFIVITLPWIAGGIYIHNNYNIPESGNVRLVNYRVDTVPKVDHSKFKILQQKFETPQQVTEACLSCHNKTDHEVMATSHWKWTRPYVTEDGDTIELGKKNIINNFCIGVSSNEPLCTSCHAGYGWKNKNFDFSISKNIDCIVCHDQTGTYKKFPGKAGLPVDKKTVFNGKTFLPPDYNKIATNVGMPKRQNCGSCHYTGGGGNNVKHGDLELALNKTNRKVDVHMGIDGANMSCVECHKTNEHKISGKLYTVSSQNKDRVSCEQCHTPAPHNSSILNSHTDRVACQTCHIPEYAKVNPTKMYWDWSTAGKRNPDGSLIVKKDSLGHLKYHSKKGTFVYETNVKPEYVWFNGKARHYLIGEKIDTSEVLALNRLQGSYADNSSKIIPVKVHRGKQIYDAVNRYLIVPHLFGKDSTAFWKNFDWDKAARTGMASIGLPYSGKYSFISTEMYWPVNHMVAPREESLSCIECHSRNSRLSAINDFYLPGRDYNSYLDLAGKLMILLSLIGVAIHATLRIVKSN